MVRETRLHVRDQFACVLQIIDVGDEFLQVFTRFVDARGRVVEFGALVSGEHRGGVQRGEVIDAGDAGQSFRLVIASMRLTPL